MSAALWATARISVGESEHVLAQSNAWEKEREADGCFGDGGRKRGGGTSDDLPNSNIYHLSRPCAHPLYAFSSMQQEGKKRRVG